MWNASAPILVGVASLALEIKIAFKNDQISLSDHGSEKIESNRIGSWKFYVSEGWWDMHACTSILVDVAFLVSEIKIAFKNGQISLLDYGLLVWE